jgi:hypothetical protein
MESTDSMFRQVCQVVLTRRTAPMRKVEQRASQMWVEYKAEAMREFPVFPTCWRSSRTSSLTIPNVDIALNHVKLLARREGGANW